VRNHWAENGRAVLNQGNIPKKFCKIFGHLVWGNFNTLKIHPKGVTGLKSRVSCDKLS
jgi:hypothetical protein